MTSERTNDVKRRFINRQRAAYSRLRNQEETRELFTLDDAKQIVIEAGYSPSASCFEDELGIYACSVECVRVGAYGTHPKAEVAFNKETKSLLIGGCLLSK